MIHQRFTCSSMAEAEICAEPEQFYIGVMFRAQLKGSVSDYLISKITGGKWDHVDTLFVPCKPKGTHMEDGRISIAEHQLVSRRQNMRELFSTYVREYYRGYVPRMWDQRKEGDYLLMLLPVTERQYERGRQYVSELCARKVPYNYTDLTLCAMPCGVSNFFGPDVKPHPIPSRLFCSQAAVLMLRYAFIVPCQGVYRIAVS